MLQKSRGVFFAGQKAPAAAATQTQRAFGTLKPTKHVNSKNILVVYDGMF
jgi:hypothetical protein